MAVRREDFMAALCKGKVVGFMSLTLSGPVSLLYKF